MNRKMVKEMKRAYQAYNRNYDKLKAAGYIMDERLSLYGDKSFRTIWRNSKDMGIKGIGKVTAEDSVLLDRKSQRSLQSMARKSGEFDYLFGKDGTFNKAAFKRNFMSGDFVAALIDLGILTKSEFEAAYYG